MAKEPKSATDNNMIVTEQVLIVTAPGGPRRRAGFSFGPEPVELTQDQLGNSADEITATLELLRADPLLKIDGRMVEITSSDD